MNNTRRTVTVTQQMKQKGIQTLLVTDPVAIFYLTGKQVDPGERFLGLLLQEDGQVTLFLNHLFTVEAEDLPMVRFADTDDVMAMVASRIGKVETLGVDKAMAARFLLPLLQAGVADDVVVASDCVDLARQQKDLFEQQLMREASAANDIAMDLVVAQIKEGMTERDLEAVIHQTFARLQTEGVSFSPSVCFGAHGAIGHHEPTTRALQQGDMVLIDMGCRLHGYCADMTRTFCFGTATDKQKTVYQLVKEANEAAIAAVRPGVSFQTLDGIARAVITKAGYGDQFTHRLGHSIGLEVHEAGDVSETNAQQLAAGMVFSIEPGIYLQGEFGVRIEDLVLVTETGHEVLNRYRKDLQELV